MSFLRRKPEFPINTENPPVISDVVAVARVYPADTAGKDTVFKSPRERHAAQRQYVADNIRFMAHKRSEADGLVRGYIGVDAKAAGILRTTRNFYDTFSEADREILAGDELITYVFAWDELATGEAMRTAEQRYGPTAEIVEVFMKDPQYDPNGVLAWKAELDQVRVLGVFSLEAFRHHAAEKGRIALLDPELPLEETA